MPKKKTSRPAKETEASALHALTMQKWTSIALGPPYLLGMKGLEVVGKPTLLQAAQALKFLQEFNERSQFFLGDLWNDTEERFPETHSQLLDHTTYSIESLRNFGWVAKSIPPSRRLLGDGVSFSKHQAVAALSNKEQDRILTKSVDDGLTLSEVRQAARLVKRRLVSQGQAVLKGKYRTILVDTVLTEDTIEVIATWAILANARLHAAVFIRHEEKHRFEVAQLLEAWGLAHKATFVFNRVVHQGPAPYNSIIHEYLLLAIRGKLPPDRLVPMESSIQVCRSDGPVPVERLQEVIGRLYDGPYLLAQSADAMTSWGDQVGAVVQA